MNFLFKHEPDNNKVMKMPEILTDTLIRDLNLNGLAKAFFFDGEPDINGKSILEKLTHDENELKYRQEISRDLLENEELYIGMKRIYVMMRGLAEIASDRTSMSKKEITNYLTTVKWISLYCNLIKFAVAFFPKHESVMKSTGLIELKRVFDEIHGNEEFRGS